MILEYIGPFDRTGKPFDDTQVRWKCELCETEFNAQLRSLKVSKNHGKVCAVCAKVGPPRSVKSVLADYPQITDVLSLDGRGGVKHTSKVKVVCRICGNVYQALFQHVLKVGGQWNCRSCGKLNQFSKVTSTSELPNYIIEVDRSTLGSLDRVTAHSRVKIICPRCKKIRWASWHNIQRLGQIFCKACATGVRWEDSEYKQWYSEMMKKKWKSPKNRKTWLENRHDNGYISGLHKRVKELLIQNGISGFESEQVIGKCRVDEVDRKRKTVLEIFGDFWHFNPELYNADSMVHRDAQLISAKSVWERDKKRLAFLRSRGYLVYVIWERDFEADPDKCVKKFKTWLKEGNK